MHLKHFFCMLFVGCVCVCVCAGLCVSDIHGSWAQFKFPPQCRGSVGRERERGEGQTAEGERERERWRSAKITHTHTHTHHQQLHQAYSRIIWCDVGDAPATKFDWKFSQIACISEAKSHTKKINLDFCPQEDGHHYWSQAAYSWPVPPQTRQVMWLWEWMICRM